MQHWLIQVALAIIVGVWLTTGVGAQTEIPADQRQQVEQRVREMEAQFRSIRDQKLAQCRGAWAQCTNQTCKKISGAEAERWHTCQDACDAEYERCKRVAYEYWSEGE